MAGRGRPWQVQGRSKYGVNLWMRICEHTTQELAIDCAQQRAKVPLDKTRFRVRRSYGLDGHWR